MQNVFKLSNGLRVVTEKIETVKSISVGIWVETGSRNEDKINNGISHFIEHMMFKGTKKKKCLRTGREYRKCWWTNKCFYWKRSHLLLY